LSEAQVQAHLDQSGHACLGHLGVQKEKGPGVAALPALKRSEKKGVRIVSLQARRHRECEEADLQEPLLRGNRVVSGESRSACTV